MTTHCATKSAFNKRLSTFVLKLRNYRVQQKEYQQHRKNTCGRTSPSTTLIVVPGPKVLSRRITRSNSLDSGVLRQPIDSDDSNVRPSCFPPLASIPINLASPRAVPTPCDDPHPISLNSGSFSFLGCTHRDTIEAATNTINCQRSSIV